MVVRFEMAVVVSCEVVECHRAGSSVADVLEVLEVQRR